MSGEFLKENGAPDGRCRFIAKDKSVCVLCYFKDGRKLKGPQLKYVTSKKQVEIRSKTWIVNGQEVFTLAVIEKNMIGRTGYFVDEKLVKSVSFIGGHTLDWLTEDQGTQRESPVEFDGLILAECNQNNELHGRGIEIYSVGEIFI